MKSLPSAFINGFWCRIKDLYNKPISKLQLTLSDLNQITCLSNIETDGYTSVTLIVKNNGHESIFKLHKTRKIDRSTINLLKKEGIITQIN